MGKTARQQLADTINRLIAERKTTHRTIVAKGGAANGPLGRLRKAEDNVGIDILDRLGAVLGMEPWQLLHPHGASAAPHFLSEDVLEVAAKLEAIKSEERREWALDMAEHAAISDPPKPQTPAPAPAKSAGTRRAIREPSKAR